MVEIKEMPYNEKYDGVLGYTKLLKHFALPLVKEYLGREKANDLTHIWQKESEVIPEGATDKEKYEIAYRNYLRNWVSAHKFMSRHRGEDGAVEFSRAAIASWQRKNASPTLSTLRLVWSISPKTAFRAFAKRLAYQLQVFTPFFVSELNGNRMIANAQHCKILDAQDGNDFCLAACQNVLPSWLEKQFNVKMIPNRNDKNCTVTFSPF